MKKQKLLALMFMTLILTSASAMAKTCSIVLDKSVPTQIIPTLESHNFTVHYAVPTDGTSYLELTLVTYAGSDGECQGGDESCRFTASANLISTLHRVIDGVSVTYATSTVQKQKHYWNNNDDDKNAEKLDSTIDAAVSAFIKHPPACE